MRMNTYKRIFGSGPLGVGLTLLLFLAAAMVEKYLILPQLGVPFRVRIGVLTVCTILAAALSIWSIRSLPTEARGRKLCITGAFRYLRHPLYAALVSIFNFGFALFLNHSVFLIVAVILHPIWHRIVSQEEKMMVKEFGEEYLQYARRTGRFFPRFSSFMKGDSK
jgi:protein-S-isoprenylcysteine O-methyltransferase Ste14